MASKNKKIVLTSLSKDVTKDNFKEGQDPDTRQSMMYEKNLGSFDTADEAIAFLNKQYGLSDDKENYTAFEDGRISYQQLEDGDGNVVEEKDEIYKKFKKGDVDLYAADYDIFIELAEVKVPTVKEISKLFKIKVYEKGGKLQRYFGKAKDYAKRGVEGVKKGYGKAKDYTNKKIHDQKKKIALQVIEDTQDKVEQPKYQKPLRAAKEIVEGIYEKGGLFDSDKPKSAINRDRKYESNEPHEKSYKRKTSPKHPHYKTKEEGGEMAKGGDVGYEKFKEGVKVKTTVFMSTEDIGGDEDIQVGTPGVVDSEPNDNEQLVGVVIKGSLHYLPQDVLEVIEKEEGGEAYGKGGKVGNKILGILNTKYSFWDLFD